MRNYLFVIFLLGGLSLFGQDTAVTFSYTDYIAVVKKHHPLVYTAQLEGEKGALELKKARGGFDPKLKGDISQKYFEEKQYYSYINGGLVIPTWFGVSLHGGYNENDGYLLNPESYTPSEGLWNAGVTVNLGKGLFIDKRRADLKQAKIIQNSTLLEQQVIQNQLVFDASQAYFEWQKAYRKLQVYSQAVANAEERLNAIQLSVIRGEKPALDTLKVSIQLQDRSLKQEQASVAEKNKRMWVNTFLWQDGYVPLELASTIEPFLDMEVGENDTLNFVTLSQTHPEVLMYENDVEISKIDLQLKKEYLKPTVQLKYNSLSANTSYNVEDYNWGAKVSYPIFTRKERASAKLSGIKLEQKRMGLLNKQAMIRYKMEAAYNQLTSSKDQMLIQEKSTEMYLQIFEAEQTLFNIGESSLFMVNVREQNYIESQIKLIDVQFRNWLAQAELKYQLVKL
ncbi:MAG: TolC family protein [Flavobacteriales bacterium]|jgi:outer membrane protein TolC|nr:TolC family protein [Flavobacteriales bacterium]